MKQIVGLVLILCCTQIVAQEVFPDGKAIPEWFRENKEVNVNALGKKYSITDYGVANDSTVVQTKKIQGVIDLAARNGGKCHGGSCFGCCRPVHRRQYPDIGKLALVIRN